MRKSFFISAVFFLFFPFISISPSEQTGRPEAAVSPPGMKAQVITVKNLPLEFIPNAGQTDRRVSFYIKASDRTLYFTPEGMTLALHKETTAPKPGRKELLNGPKERKPSPGESWVVKMDFIGARKDVVPEGLDKTGAVFSYFKGSRDDWRTGLPGYRRIIYRDLWPGVDLVYKGDVGRLKYEFIVGPGANPGQIQLGIRGAKGVAVDKKGRLVMETPLEKIIDERPLVYQDNRTGERNLVEAAYKLKITNPGSAQIRFSVADYDRSLPLVIDPATLVYCGYIGGSGEDASFGIAVDGLGCAYVTGGTKSTEATFPVDVGPDLIFNGNQDVFVTKVKADGTGLDYCGYIGGSHSDWGNGIAVDGSGNAYITGYTDSTETTFPIGVGPDLTYNGGFYDAFVAKVNASGTALTFCGYIGGSHGDWGYGIAVDGSGYAYIAGYTDSSNTTFPIAIGPNLTDNGLGDGFVAKVSPSGTSLNYCGYVGGFGYDDATGIAVDGLGCAYITGDTQSNEITFPVAIGPGLTYSGGDFDAYVAKVNASGSALDYCGFIGGAGSDISWGIGTDGSGNAYISGVTNSTETTFPVVAGPDLTYNGGFYDAFVAKVNASGTGLDYCGYIGGSDYDRGYGIAVDGSGCAYVTGLTFSTEATFPVATGPDLTHNGYIDAFVAKVNASGAGVDYCGFIGGSAFDEALEIAVDASSCAYITGYTKSTETTFPVVAGPDLTQHGSFDAFVAKIAYGPEERFADISLSKAADNLTPYVDDTVVFTVSVANLGPDNATGVVVKDMLPVGLSFVSASASQGAYDQATGLWTVGAVNDGSSATLTLRAIVNKEGVITNTATTAGLNETDPNALNNSASVSLTAEYKVYAPSSFTLQRLESDLIFSKEYINRLTWTANQLNKSVIVSLRLYRKAKSQPDTAFALYKEFAPSVTSFDDRGLKKDELFTYRMTSVNEKGKESDPTEAGN